MGIIYMFLYAMPVIIQCKYKMHYTVILGIVINML